MDQTFKNVSQLQEALSKMKRPSESPTPTTSRTSTPVASSIPDNTYYQYPAISTVEPNYSSAESNAPLRSADRTNSSQMSTSSLLLNMAALQTSTNNKLDKLTAAVFGLHNAMDKVNREQVKQTELLNTIARNTSNLQINISEASTPSRSSKVKPGSIKEYGFSTTKQLFAEFLMKLLQQIESQIIRKNRQYNSTRDMNLKLTTQIINAAMTNEFKVNGVLDAKIDANSLSHPSLTKVAACIGSNDDTNPVLTPDAFKEIFDDVASKYFVSCFQKILERMRIIKLLIPFYEADIICAIQFPYFDKSGDIICDWNKIMPREESISEKKVAVASVGERAKLAQYLAKGMTERAAIGAALGN